MTTPAQEAAHWDRGAGSYLSDAFTPDIIDLLLKELPPGKTLEIGAGRGRLTSRLAKHLDYKLYGIDISSKMLDYAPKDRVLYKTNDGRTIPYGDLYFNNIYSVTVFQHLPEPGKIDYINEAYRTLKYGGIFLFQFIAGKHRGDFDHNSELSEMRYWLDAAGYSKLHFLPQHIHPHWTWARAVK